MARYARLIGLRSLMAIDHFQNIFPTAAWDEEFSWLATQRPTPHEHFDYQAVLGHLAGHAGNLRLGVGVTDPIRRHPVLIAQGMLTLAHMTRHAPILGIGAGERMNIDPYGLDFSHPVDRLEEALQIIRMCFSQVGRLDFKGHHYTLDGALMELKAPPGRTPIIWVAGHGPRMLELTATYGDGWYPTMLATPQEYATKLEAVRTSARVAGRNPRDILPALHRFLVVAPTERDARAQLEHKAIRALGLGTPAEQWARVGAQHPFGPSFRGYIDLVADRYDRRTIDEAIAAVPPELVENGPLLWGSPEQVADKLREFGDAGLRHVVLAPVSGLVSKSAAVYSLWAIRGIAHSLAHARRG
ncbi:phthiodiolone/phenolphthiodiolone dimycocerosates ketoreductase [Pseudonocardia zijingensis]|uniref:Phthiodiolone/phenolphthiodiolone dimycocerosates ketoreductase n=1 Tax=Pseudonocardia zijingensis TaxID=153376 RepID=A0ABN1P4N0_9PSEU